MLLAYAAKKRAEVAPGVGEATDMFIIGVELGNYRAVPDIMLKVLEEIYKGVREETQKAVDKSQGQINDIFKAIIASATKSDSEEQTTTSDAAGEVPPDEKEVRGLSDASQPESEEGEQVKS